MPLPDFLFWWYQNPLFASLKTFPDAYAAMCDRRLKNSPGELSAALKGLGTGQQPSLWDTLAQVKQPLLLLVGGLDPKFVAINREMMAVIKSKQLSRLTVLEDYGHNLHLEAPALCVRTILKFYLQHISTVKSKHTEEDEEYR